MALALASGFPKSWRTPIATGSVCFRVKHVLELRYAVLELRYAIERYSTQPLGRDRIPSLHDVVTYWIYITRYLVDSFYSLNESSHSSIVGTSD